MDKAMAYRATLLMDEPVKHWCEKRGINRQMFYENGRKQVSIRNLCKIADGLGCTTDYLLGRSDNPHGND